MELFPPAPQLKIASALPEVRHVNDTHRDFAGRAGPRTTLIQVSAVPRRSNRSGQIQIGTLTRQSDQITSNNKNCDEANEEAAN